MRERQRERDDVVLCWLNPRRLGAKRIKVSRKREIN